jgi:phosphatidylinositol glycan class M
MLLILFDTLNAYLIAKLIPDSLDRKIGLFFWFLNTMSILLSTRGSADTIISTFVLITIILIMRKSSAVAGLFFGFSIHLKIYPIVLSLLLYLYIGQGKFFINFESIKFSLATVLSLSFWTGIFYKIYG